MRTNPFYRFLPILSMTYVMAIIVPSAIGYKLISFGPFLVNAGTCVFPFSYLFGDLITECYGYNIARKIIWSAALCSLVYGALVSMVFYFPHDVSVKNPSSYHYVLSRTFVFLFGGTLGGVLGGFFNSYALSKWKILLKGRYFWLRSIGSSLLGDFLELLIITLIAYVAIYPLPVIIRMFSTVYLFRMLFCCVMAYPAQSILKIIKRSEGVDIYDEGIQFNPFRLN